MSADVLRLAQEGGRARRAAALVARERPRLEAALRRALPFIARRGLGVAFEGARPALTEVVAGALPRPHHVVAVTAEPGGLRGALLFDAGAAALVLDGVLGGDGRAPPTLSPDGLSPAQVALLGRAAEGLIRALSDALGARLGVRLAAAPAPRDEPAGESPLAIVLAFGAEPEGRVVLFLAKEAVLAREEHGASDDGPTDARVAATLEGVELELVVELARVRMALGTVGRLRVGDTLPLDLPVDGSVAVRTDGRVLLRGRPTAVGGCIAVQIEPGHGA